MHERRPRDRGHAHQHKHGECEPGNEDEAVDQKAGRGTEQRRPASGHGSRLDLWTPVAAHQPERDTGHVQRKRRQQG